MSSVNFSISSKDIWPSVAVPVFLGIAALTTRIVYDRLKYREPVPSKGHLATLFIEAVPIIGGFGAFVGATSAVWNRQNPGQEALKAFGFTAGTMITLAAISGKHKPKAIENFD